MIEQEKTAAEMLEYYKTEVFDKMDNGGTGMVLPLYVLSPGQTIQKVENLA